jgi:hypothetical protein
VVDDAADVLRPIRRRSGELFVDRMERPFARHEHHGAGEGTKAACDLEEADSHLPQVGQVEVGEV